VTAQPRGSALYERFDPYLLGQRQFRAMNTTIQLYTRDVEDVGMLPAAEQVFHLMEARLSRFLPDSELSQFNERSGQEVEISPILFDVLQRAAELHRATGGVFEPAVLTALEAAGYDRSFEKVAPAEDSAPRETDDRHSIAQLKANHSRITATMPAGMRIDLGGIGKGYTVDAACRMLEPAANFVVNAGGDIFASGEGPDGDGWLVSITDPRALDQSVCLVRLYDEAVATSTTAVRRWQRGGRLQHHLIDPRTRRPSESGVLSASVITGSATEADVFAKAALLLGPEAGTDFLDRQEAHGLFVMEDGRIIATEGWPGTPNG